MTASQILIFWLSKEKKITLLSNNCNRHHRDFLYTIGAFENQYLIFETLHERTTPEDLFILNREQFSRNISCFDTPFTDVFNLLDEEFQESMPNVSFDFFQGVKKQRFDGLDMSLDYFSNPNMSLIPNSINLELKHCQRNDGLSICLLFRQHIFTENTALLVFQKYQEILSALPENAHMPLQHIIVDFYQKS